jgi:hypothetical protein
MRTIVHGLLACLLTVNTWAQDTLDFQSRFRLPIVKCNGPITIDGLPNEPVWTEAPVASGFREKWPNDRDMAKRQTLIRSAFDDTYLYFFIVAIDTSYYVAQTLKRDAGLYDSDAISIALDPVNLRTNGFLFSVTPYNVQREDLVSAGMEDPGFSWNDRWFSATRRYDTCWTAEIAIPFSTLRYKQDKTVWGVNFLRSDLKNNQYSSWTHMPTNFNFYDFGYSGALVWPEPPPAPSGLNGSFIPYMTGGLASDREAGKPLTGNFNGGFDGKLAVSPSLNLDVTVNPDFSQIEVDRQVTNLTRFNIFFPERRTFFLENDDLFSGYGIPPIRPFYSRRIGLDPEGRQIPIIGGLRLSGNLDQRTRIGLMNIQTLAARGYRAQNYTAATFNTRVQARSLVKGYFLNRQSFQGKDGDATDTDAFGRNLGLQYDFTDKPGKWSTWTGFHKSFKPDISGADMYLNGGIMYATKPWQVIVDYSDVGVNYHTDMGFVNRIENYDALADTSIRKAFRQTYNNLQHRIFPEGGRFGQHRIELENFTVWNQDFSLNESNLTLTYEGVFRNTANIAFDGSFTRNNLPFHTRFTADRYLPLPPGRYDHLQAGASFSTDGRKRLIFSSELRAGGFFNGRILQASATLTWRAQPWGNFSIYAEQARLHFPEPYGKTSLLLFAPRIEVNFSNNLFWTTFLQYNNQNNNFNVNSRLQWRFKPMSDIFIVYTDNYFTDPLLRNKNRALVFKANFWLKPS